MQMSTRVLAVAAPLVALAGSAFAQVPTWEPQLVGSAPAGWSTVAASAVNDGGRVVGNTFIAGFKRAWTGAVGSGLELLPLPAEATWSDVRDVNGSGVAVGSVLLGGGLSRAILWRPVGGIYAYELLPAGPGGTLPFDARAINDAGDVVGKYGILSGSFVWNELSGTVQLPTTTFPVVPEGLNERRQVVGDTYRMDLDDLVLEDLGNPTGTPYNFVFSKLGSINDAGQCAGYGVTATSQNPFVPIRFTDGGAWKLFSNFPLSAAGALGLSAFGDTVFQLGVFGLYVYVDEVGSIALQGTLDPAFGSWSLGGSFAPAISRGGALACNGVDPFGSGGIVLLTPAAFDDLGGAVRGALGDPILGGFGSLLPGTPTRLRLASAAPNSVALIAWSGSSVAVPLLGGTLHANPIDVLVPVGTDSLGRYDVTFNWPNLSTGTEAFLQAAVVDPETALGWSLSNGLSAATR
ncbi:hypothetical protein [Engelhardtia mirabilis]|uniref:Uncharacterized protein n=1 Tax=Engelhardtia mirabilis TaxID=2528011 RepID=A0A518BMJ8_9BACT|nr:hypothetical protein Pla133_32600 [Planctomycetes bacterium Pla133]QDV02492.1 hypothetical protein Pla86_32590 [Planctomycetes bacterium Pla86]